MKYILTLSIFYLATLMPLHSLAKDELIAYVENLPPSVIVSEDNISGAVIDILTEALRHSDISIEYQNINWSRALYESKNKPNVVLTGLNRTLEREKQFYWLLQLSKATERQDIYLWQLKKTQADEKQKSLNDAVVAMVQGDHKIQYYRDYIESLGFKANIYEVGSREQVIHMLFKGRVDYILGGELNRPWHVEALGYDLAMIERGLKIPNTSKGLYIAISRDTDIRLVHKIEGRLVELARTGRVSEIMAAWSKKIK